MFNTLYLLNYNNYYNRLVKSEETLDDYLNYTVASVAATNFNPNDNVSTSHICSIEDTINPDYAIVVDGQGNIISRWFVIESERVRGGQYRLSFYRDTIVDFYNIIAEAPCFIEKGIVPDSDSAIFNSEEITVNRIKTAETPLKDATKVSWIVAYLARDKAMNGSEIENRLINGQVSPPGTVDISSELTKGEWEQENKAVATNMRDFKFNFNFYNKVGYNPAYYLQVNLYKQNANSTPTASFSTKEQQNKIASSAAAMSGIEFDTKYKSTYAEIMNYIPTASGLTETNPSAYNALNNLTITFEDDRTQVYRIQLIKTNKTYKSNTSNTSTVPNGDPMYSKVQSLWNTILPANPQNAIAVGRFYGISYEYTEYSLTLVPEGTTQVINYNIPIDREELVDAPYDMICAPYEDTKIMIDGIERQSTTQQVLAVFNDIAVRYAGESAIVYDIQRLPYCPISQLKTINGVLETSLYSGASQMFPITITQNGQDIPISAIFACTESNFYRSIALENPIVINNAKMQSICDVYRLCSPNYNGVFEFDAAMNGGVSAFNVYCTYKPFNPYIQVAPEFGRLYGKDFEDARGLICGGEWSMPIVTSAWATYERQNANYMNTFNRQIENMKITHKVQKEQEWYGAITGAITGMASGFSIPILLGGGAGAGAVGAGLAGAASLWGGHRDMVLNNQLRNEAIDFAQDQFGYQLGNIQALPTTLSRVSAFTINNKIFPFLEYYTCTPEEKEAVANKIAYNGMTIMRIGTISNYVSNVWSYDDIIAQNYIKGRIIRLEALKDDTHIANTISKELNKGLYFGG